MKPLTVSETKNIEGGFPWIPIIIVGCIMAAGFVNGCNEARYETTAKE